MLHHHQSIYKVYEHQKTDLLLHLLAHRPEIDQAIIFLRTRDGVHSLSTTLRNADINIDSLHGNKKPELRDRALKDLRESRVRILVSTESSVRDLDLTGIHYFIHFEFHELDEDYLLRCDHAKKSGGEVITFVTQKETSLFQKLELLVETELPEKTAEDFSYDDQPRVIKAPTAKGSGPNKTKSKPLQHKKPKLKNKGPRRKTGRTRKR